LEAQKEKSLGGQCYPTSDGHAPKYRADAE
jgi:hypothetical protein